MSKRSKSERFAVGDAVTVWKHNTPKRRDSVAKVSRSGYVLGDGSRWKIPAYAIDRPLAFGDVDAGTPAYERIERTNADEETRAILYAISWGTVPPTVRAEVVTVLERSGLWPLSAKGSGT